MSSFWTAVQNVSTNPEDTGARQALAQSAQALGLSFQTAFEGPHRRSAPTSTRRPNAMVAQVNADANRSRT